MNKKRINLLKAKKYSNNNLQMCSLLTTCLHVFVGITGAEVLAQRLGGWPVFRLILKQFLHFVENFPVEQLQLKDVVWRQLRSHQTLQKLFRILFAPLPPSSKQRAARTTQPRCNQVPTGR